ncbi:hypothetical protein [Kitasatospora cinereorecta]|uniref:DUF317 domain-containing protein n=1 Tax=Kitasatospora cinereorecta TaxID=285560 RepID=A0ABW0VID3_9ACTN
MPARNRRLPRDLSWPLTPTDLRAVPGAEDADLWFNNRPSDDGTLLHAEWIPPIRSNYGVGLHPSVWSTVRIRISPLPGTERAHARSVLRSHALPELAAWIAAARRAPEAWILSRHSRSWRLTGGTTTHREDHQPYR